MNEAEGTVLIQLCSWEGAGYWIDKMKLFEYIMGRVVRRETTENGLNENMCFKYS